MLALRPPRGLREHLGRGPVTDHARLHAGLQLDTRAVARENDVGEPELAVSDLVASGLALGAHVDALDRAAQVVREVADPEAPARHLGEQPERILPRRAADLDRVSDDDGGCTVAHDRLPPSGRQLREHGRAVQRLPSS